MFLPEVEEISTTEPPYVAVTLGYWIPRFTREHAGEYKCQLGDQEAKYTLIINGKDCRQLKISRYPVQKKL